MTDHNDERRIAIQNSLAEFVLHELGCAMVTPSMEAWTGSPLSGTFRYGWAPPFAIADNGMLVVVSICPELIAAITEQLSDDELDAYLAIIKFFIDELVAAPERPYAEVIRETEDLIYEMDPNALRLISSVESHALDLGITA